MINTLWQMALLIACGLAWQWIKPLKSQVDQQRQAISRLVYYTLLPALVLQAMWQSRVSLQSLQVGASAAACILVSMALIFAWSRWTRMPKNRAGALILAASFANAIYLGLPILEHSLGPWARGVAIQYDYFAASPLFYTLGIWIAAKHGNRSGESMHSSQLFYVPAFWAAIAGSLLSMLNIPMPGWLNDFCLLLARCVTPLMVIAIGLALTINRSLLREFFVLIPVFIIQLLIMPAVAWLCAFSLATPSQTLVAVVLEAAMPCMVIGIVLCDQFHLDGRIYAAAVTLSTLLSMLTLPLWYSVLGA